MRKSNVFNYQPSSLLIAELQLDKTATDIIKDLYGERLLNLVIELTITVSLFFLLFIVLESSNFHILISLDGFLF